MKLLFQFLFLVNTLNCVAQNPSIVWQKTLGGSFYDSSNKILKDELSNALFLIGSSNSNTSFDKSEDRRGERDIWVIKTSLDGSVLWDKTIGGSANDFSVSALIDGDLLYILTASLSPASGDKTSESYGLMDYWLVCLDFDGNIIWDRSYGGENTDSPKSMIRLKNGNLLLAGSSMSGVSGNKSTLSKGETDYWIVEVNPADGSVISQKSIGTNAFDNLFSVTQDDLGNLYLAGTSFVGADGDKTDPGYGSDDVWIVKIDEDYTIISDKCFGGSDNEDQIGEIVILNEKLYLLNSTSSSISGNKTSENFGQQDYWLVKINLDLTVIWDKSFGGNNFDRPYSILSQPADKLILMGTSHSDISGNKTAVSYGESTDIWMVIVDKDGNEIGQETYGGDSDDWASSVVGDNHGLLYVLGGSESGISGVKTENNKGASDYWLLKLDATDFLSVDKIEVENGITVYPNPYTNTVNFVVGAHSEPLLLSLYSLDGKIVFQTLIPTEMNHFVWDADTEMNQILIFEIRSNEELVTGKLVRGY